MSYNFHQPTDPRVTHDDPPLFVLFETYTGGGCTALQMNLPAGHYLLFTDTEGSSVPVAGEPYLMGLYDMDGDTVTSPRILQNWSTR